MLSVWSFEKIFFQARLLINYLTVVQQKRSNSISCEKVELKNRKLFKRKVHNLMNVLRMTTANKISPRRKQEQEDFQVEVVLASKLAYFMWGLRVNLRSNIPVWRLTVLQGQVEGGGEGCLRVGGGGHHSSEHPGGDVGVRWITPADTRQTNWPHFLLFQTRARLRAEERWVLVL